jgi:hypothetical protein
MMIQTSNKNKRTFVVFSSFPLPFNHKFHDFFGIFPVVAVVVVHVTHILPIPGRWGSDGKLINYFTRHFVSGQFLNLYTTPTP